MFGRLPVLAGGAETLFPLIQEAKDRQRRRRLLLVQIAVLAAALGLATAASTHGAGPAAVEVSGSGGAAKTDVRGVIARFDAALSAGDFAQACSLVDPWMGMATLRAATNEVGVHGNCEERLAATARILGARLVDALERSSMPSVEIARSDGGFIAAAVLQVPNETVRRNNWDSVVAVAKPSPGAKVLITCPPLLCNSDFLKYVRAQTA